MALAALSHGLLTCGTFGIEETVTCGTFGRKMFSRGFCARNEKVWYKTPEKTEWAYQSRCYAGVCYADVS